MVTSFREFAEKIKSTVKVYANMLILNLFMIRRFKLIFIFYHILLKNALRIVIIHIRCLIEQVHVSYGYLQVG